MSDSVIAVMVIVVVVGVVSSAIYLGWFLWDQRGELLAMFKDWLRWPKKQ